MDAEGISYLVGIFVAIVLIASVAIPSVFAPRVANQYNYDNTTDYTNLAMNNQYVIDEFTLTNLYASGTGIIDITYSNIAADKVNVTSSDGTYIGTLDGSGFNRFNLTAVQIASMLKS